MIVRELVTLLGFQVQEDALKKYENGMKKVMNFTKWVGIGAAAMGTIFLKTAGDMEQTEMAFETILGSTEKAQKLLADLAKFATITPFEQTELINYTKSMLGVGWASEEIIPMLETMGNIASGVGREKLPNIILALNKMRAKGRASLEELWPMVEAGVPILDQLQLDLGKTNDEIMKMASDGKLSFEVIRKSLKNVEQTKFAGLMIKQSKSFLGIISNIIDYLVMFGMSIGKYLLPYAKDLAVEFVDFLEVNGDIIKSGIIGFFRFLAYTIGYAVVIIQEIIIRLGGMDKIMNALKITITFIGAALLKVGKTLWDFRIAVLAVISTLLIYNALTKVIAAYKFISYWIQLLSMAKNIGEALKVLNLQFLASPLFWWVAGIVAIIAIGYLLIKNWDKVKVFFVKMWDSIIGAFKRAGAWIVDTMKKAFQTVWGWFDSPWLQAALAMFAPFIGLPIVIMKNWGVIKDFFVKLWEAIVNNFSEKINAIKKIWGWLSPVFDKIGKFIGGKSAPGGNQSVGGGEQGKPYEVPQYAKGTNYVPEDQIAKIHKGEQIIPAGVRGRTGGTIINLRNEYNFTIPPGTPRQQVESLRKVIDEQINASWQSVLRQTTGAFPAPEGV